MNEILTIIKAIACAGIFWRIYTYKWPKDSTYRLGITAIAYATMLLVGAQAICLMTGNIRASQYFDAGIYLAFLALFVVAKGNIANVVRLRWETTHGKD